MSHERGLLPPDGPPPRGRKARVEGRARIPFCSIPSPSPPFSLVPPHTGRPLTAMAWIQSVWEGFLEQEIRGPFTFFKFRRSLLHFAASALDVLHHRRPLLEAARHSPGRKAKEEGFEHYPWQGLPHPPTDFPRLLHSLYSPPPVPLFPVHSAAKSGHSPQGEVSCWPSKHSVLPRGPRFSVS